MVLFEKQKKVIFLLFFCYSHNLIVPLHRKCIFTYVFN